MVCCSGVMISLTGVPKHSLSQNLRNPSSSIRCWIGVAVRRPCQPPFTVRTTPTGKPEAKITAPESPAQSFHFLGSAVPMPLGTENASAGFVQASLAAQPWGFEDFWHAIGKTGTREFAEIIWRKLSIADKLAIREWFRNAPCLWTSKCYAATWLKERRWESDGKPAGSATAQATSRTPLRNHMITAGTPQWEAWKETGRFLPADVFSWYVESPWPPGHPPEASERAAGEAAEDEAMTPATRRNRNYFDRSG